MWKRELQPPPKNNPQLTQCELQAVCLRVCGSMLKWAGLSMCGCDYLKNFINVSLANPEPFLPCHFSFLHPWAKKMSRFSKRPWKIRIPISAISKWPDVKSFSKIPPHPLHLFLITAHLKQINDVYYSVGTASCAFTPCRLLLYMHFYPIGETAVKYFKELLNHLSLA